MAFTCCDTVPASKVPDCPGLSPLTHKRRASDMVNFLRSSPHLAPPGFGTVVKDSGLQEPESPRSSHGRSAYDVSTAPKKVPGAGGPCFCLQSPVNSSGFVGGIQAALCWLHPQCQPGLIHQKLPGAARTVCGCCLSHRSQRIPGSGLTHSASARPSPPLSHVHSDRVTWLSVAVSFEHSQWVSKSGHPVEA